mgnify:FL=1
MRPLHIEEALAQLHTGQWYGWSDPKNKVYSNIVVLDDTKSHPTENEINNKLTELQADYDKKATDKANANAKLKALGLTDDEIKAIKS